MTDLTALSAARRTADLASLGDGRTVDVVVIGGGITGVGIALDAASRGLSVVLVESHDLAFGTSRWSSKLVHGGLRYLASGNIGIARRSSVERGILMSRTAPHLVKAMPQLVPLLPTMSRSQRALVRVGFLAGDALRALAGTRSSVLPRSGRISASQAVSMAPTVRRDGLDGALLANQGGFVSPSAMQWSQSGMLLIMVILGGVGHLYGGLAGAALFLIMEEVLVAYTIHWQFGLGAVLLAVVLLAPNGLMSLGARASQLLKSWGARS